MSISRERQIWNYCSEMQHRCELNSKLSRGMHRNADLKRFTNSSGFHAGANAAPERCIEQHNIDRSVANIRCQLFEIYYHGVRGEGHPNFLAHAPHSIHTKHRIFQIIVSNVFDLLPKPDCSLGGPDAIRIEAKTISVKCLSKRTVTLEFIFGRKYSSLQLM